MSRRRAAAVPALFVLVIAAALYLTQRAGDPPAGPTAPQPRAGRDAAATQPANDNELVARLFKERRSNVVVEVSGQVERTLRDDTQGSAHQKFLVRLAPHLTLLVAHNIDVAPRVPVQRGSAVRLRGEYEWNAQGGVLHWTHRDPQGRHQDGWIEFEGRRYQ